VRSWVAAAALIVCLLGALAADGRTQGADPLAALPAAPPASRLDPPPSRPCPPIAPDCLDISRRLTFPAFLTWSGNDVANFWASAFRQAGIRWRSARQRQLKGGSVGYTRCSGGFRVVSTDGPFYCAADASGTVFLPLVGIEAIVFPRTSFRNVDFALSYVVAHEWGHHIQALLGLYNARTPSRTIELQADCLAGIWAHSVWARQLLETGDIDEAMRLARLVGDRPGTASNEAHGTAQQRASAFRRGYSTGNPGRC